MEFSKNLRRLRLAKKLTQEQVAGALGVSAQSVSRWECAATLPDVTMLPAIARLYGVTVDDLYRENSVAYDNYAQRLAGVFESTLDPEDFIQADREFGRLLKTGDYTAEDLRLYGILYQHMMFHCKEQAMLLFNRVLDKGPAEEPETYWRVCRQKGFLLHELGRDDVSIQRYLPKVEAGSEEVNEWICLIQTYGYAGEKETALHWAEKAARKFPENAILHIYTGDLYKAMGKIDQAFFHWRRAGELEPEWDDSRYSMASYYEEVGDYENACKLYEEIADGMEARGFGPEVAYPRKLAETCREKMKSTTP